MWIIPLIAIAAFFILLLQELNKDEPMKTRENSEQKIYTFKNAPIGKLVILNGNIVANMTHEDEKEKIVYYNYTFGCLQDVDRDDQTGNSKVVEYLGSITVQNDYEDD